MKQFSKKANWRQCVVLQHDNANMTKTINQEFGWEVLPYPPYSLHLAPSDFQSFFNALCGVTFNTDVELRVWLNG